MYNIVRMIPNMMTVFRIIVIPLIICFLSYDDLFRLISLALFVIASLFDFLDGYLARILKVQSTLGKVLDPIADKMIVILLFIFLINIGDINGSSVYAVLLIVMRELIISGIREYIGSNDRSSGYLSKVKTFGQMIAISMIITSGFSCFNLNVIYHLTIAGDIMLWYSAILSIISGVIYIYNIRYLLK